MSLKKKIGILGGTFNPIHNGHLMIAENAYMEYQLDEVWFMPARIPPHKQDMHILRDDLRYEMVSEAVKEVSYFHASDFELTHQGVSYTANTLQRLSILYPDYEFYFIMGADSLEQMETWYHPEIIFEYASIIATVRDDLDFKDILNIAKELKTKYNGNILLLDIPKLDISSTMLRNRVKEDKSIRYFVPNSVVDYINKKHLYR